ncbi:MAG: hypothetical protein R3183_09740 [Oleiphilaceae bacterium]|nr:hypothetical protein [Oleiphilaceae bacterium]
MRSKALIHRLLALFLGFNLLVAGSNVSSMVLSQNGAVAPSSIHDQHANAATQHSVMPESCHDMAMDSEASAASVDAVESCCDDPCDCNGPTCGGASVASKSLHTPWLSKQVSALFIPSLYLNLPDGPTSPPPISRSI